MTGRPSRNMSRPAAALMLFPGPDTDPVASTRICAASGPASCQSWERAEKLDEKSGLKMEPSSIKHPALAMFKDTTNLHLSGAQFYSYFRSNRSPTKPIWARSA